MAYTLGRRQGIAIAVVVGILLIVALFAWTFVRPFDTPEETSPTSTPVTTQPMETAEEPAEEEKQVDEADTPTIDPATVSTVPIEQLSVAVPYITGIPAFSYSLEETGSGTQYATFYAEELKGTRCTDDEGAFAIVVKNPKSTEDQATLSLTKKVGQDTYGLSLTGSNCTGDAALFNQYQAAFKDAFGLIKGL
jgi:cytoskeletal protein RodZ